jgi:hypothetical protein
MSDFDPRLHATIPGEWYWLAGIFNVVTEQLDNTKVLIGGPVAYGAAWEVYENAPGGLGGQVGTISFLCDIQASDTAVSITIGSPTHVDYWRDVVDQLVRAGRFAHSLRRKATEPTIQELLNEYQQALDAGRRVSLRDLASRAGISYDYLRKRKSQIDRTKN